MASPTLARPQAEGSQQADVRAKVIQVLASTANGCLSELGYFPGIPQKLHQTIQYCTKLQADNTKLFEDNQKLQLNVSRLYEDNRNLSSIAQSQKERLELLNNADNTKVKIIGNMQEQLKGLQADRAELIRRNELLGQNLSNEERYQRLWADFMQLQEKHRTMSNEVMFLRTLSRPPDNRGKGVAAHTPPNSATIPGRDWQGRPQTVGVPGVPTHPSVGSSKNQHRPPVSIELPPVYAPSQAPRLLGWKSVPNPGTPISPVSQDILFPSLSRKRSVPVTSNFTHIPSPSYSEPKPSTPVSPVNPNQPVRIPEFSQQASPPQQAPSPQQASPLQQAPPLQQAFPLSALPSSTNISVPTGPHERPVLEPIQTTAVLDKALVDSPAQVAEEIPPVTHPGLKRKSTEPPEEARKKIRTDDDQTGFATANTEPDEEDEEEDEEEAGPDDPVQYTIHLFYDDGPEDKLVCRLCRSRYEGGFSKARAPFERTNLDELVGHVKDEHPAAYEHYKKTQEDEAD